MTQFILYTLNFFAGVGVGIVGVFAFAKKLLPMLPELLQENIELLEETLRLHKEIKEHQVAGSEAVERYLKQKQNG